MYIQKRNLNQLLTALVCVLLILSACSERNATKSHDDSAAKENNYEEQIREALDTDPNRILQIIDSLENCKAIEEYKMLYYRAQAYYKLGQELTAELYYKKALSNDDLYLDRPARYYYACDQLSTILTCKGDQLGSIDIATKGYAKARDDQSDDGRHWGAILLHDIGYCQMRLDRIDEAEKSFHQAYATLKEMCITDSSFNRVNGWARVAYNILDAYTSTGHYKEATQWIPSAEEAIRRMANLHDCPPNVAEEYLGSLNTHKAIIYIKTDHKREANEAYQEFMNSSYAKTSFGLIDNSEYLLEAERWSERADLIPQLDSLTKSWDMPMSFYYLAAYMVPNFNAALNSGRTSQALQIAKQIAENIDSVNNYESQHNAAELAIVYETQEKERQIEEQRAQLSYQRMAALAAVLLASVLFLAVFIYFRHRAAMKLEEKNRELELKNCELTVANARAEDSSRMKTNFIQQISHEIRTPLNILSGFTQVLTASGLELDDATRQEANEKIMENTKRITGLVNKMLELSDINSQAVIEMTDDVTPAEIAAKAASDSGIVSAAHIQFDLKIDDNIGEQVRIHTNERQAVRTLELLLDNAQKFTKQGRVVLSVGKTQDGFVAFSVEDTGIGVPAYEAERIFGEFVQLDEYYDGTGIGLAVARSIARRLGGDVKLDINYANGARFVMTLPLT